MTVRVDEDARVPAPERRRSIAADLSTQDTADITAFARLLTDERAAAPRASLETLIDRAVTRSSVERPLPSAT